MTNQTKKRYENILDKPMLSENDIVAFKAQLNKHRYSEGSNINDIIYLFAQNRVKYDGYDLTPEHTEKGINYLISKTYTLNGKLRKNNKFSGDELVILANFDKFKLIGFFCEPEFNNTYVPVYRVFDKNGKYFDYTGVRYDFIRVLE
jgi:hypothetical protein